jgi:hypothetical protein
MGSQRVAGTGSPFRMAFGVRALYSRRMRSLLVAGLGIGLLAGMSGSAIAARPATHGEVVALQGSVHGSLRFGDRVSSVTVVSACISTRERGFAAVILQSPRWQSRQMITLFHRNPHLRPVWNMYGFASPQNLWFAKSPTNPYATRLRAERDMHANCGLPAWATAKGRAATSARSRVVGGIVCLDPWGELAPRAGPLTHERSRCGRAREHAGDGDVP